MPQVSVIIPNYNHAAFLQQRIELVLAQTYQDFEILLLDDCSTDNSRQLIELYRGHEKVSNIVLNDVNSGSPFKQWKTGIELSAGNFIWIAESDDVADPQFLEALMKPFSDHRGVVISSCRSMVIDDNNQHLGLQASSDELNATKWNFAYVEDLQTELKHYVQFMCTLPNASAVVFKKPTNLNGLLDTRMRYAGDWRFWINMMHQKGKIAYTPQTLNYFRRHSQTTRSVTNVNADKEKIRYKELNSFLPPFFINVFEKRYDWIIRDWAQRKNTFKHSLIYYTTLLHPVLAARYYARCIKKRLTHS